MQHHFVKRTFHLKEVPKRVQPYRCTVAKRCIYYLYICVLNQILPYHVYTPSTHTHTQAQTQIHTDTDTDTHTDTHRHTQTHTPPTHTHTHMYTKNTHTFSFSLDLSQSRTDGKAASMKRGRTRLSICETSASKTDEMRTANTVFNHERPSSQPENGHDIVFQ